MWNVLWIVIPSSFAGGYQRFDVTYFLHLQGNPHFKHVFKLSLASFFAEVRLK
jgi:hypothetical protein